MSKNIGMIEQIANELLEHMGISVDGLAVVESGDGFRVNIEAKADSGVLIGYRGDSLSAFQQILALICYRRSEEWLRILVDVEGYRNAQRERLADLAVGAAKRARFLQESVPLPPMNSYERRLVHTAVSGISGVRTESVGEGRERREERERRKYERETRIQRCKDEDVPKVGRFS